MVYNDLEVELKDKLGGNYPVHEVINELREMGILNLSVVRNFLIRKDFDKAMVSGDYDYMKVLFIDLSIKYDLSTRQVQRIIYNEYKK